MSRTCDGPGEMLGAVRGLLAGGGEKFKVLSKISRTHFHRLAMRRVKSGKTVPGNCIR